ncbi:MAG: PTS sugar transporter subunit IIA [candidate division WOR-3 bacterium]|jgi:PTS system nitrogen regulatory IIA component|nr:PTS sugar transporter subunit IIA [candidate division WOR-3 bacterium]MCR4424425.1 PTS sugar transporter subunit IIA [candidate division WOR-3 bacterium]MDH7518243.1 PTS sugar transporter subunit IIA [bacterium]
MMNLFEFVIPELAFDAPPIGSQEQLFDLIADRLLEAGITRDHNEVIEGFRKREELCSTGVGHGVAIPHSATPSLDRIVVVVVRLNNPIDWHARDNEPVNLVVALVSPPSMYSLYLQVLATLARALHLAPVRQLALTAPTAADAARLIAQSAQQQEEGGEPLIEPVC